MKYAVMRLQNDETQVRVTSRQDLIGDFINGDPESCYVVRAFDDAMTNADIIVIMSEVTVIGS